MGMRGRGHLGRARRRTLWLTSVLVLWAFAGCREGEPPSAPSRTAPEPPEPAGFSGLGESSTVSIGDRSWRVAIAATPARRTEGLSGVTRLAADEGMLFVFEEPSVQRFWMQGCRIPLDVAFIDADGRIVAMHTMAAEPPRTPPERMRKYSSGVPVLYALEVRAGALADAQVQLGDRVRLPKGATADNGR